MLFDESHLICHQASIEKECIHEKCALWIKSSNHVVKSKEVQPNLVCHESHDHPHRESSMHSPTQIVK
jgi:hypothetical protein